MLEKIIDEVIIDNPILAEQAKAGVDGSLPKLLSEIVKRTRRSEKPANCNEMLASLYKRSIGNM